MDFKQKVNERAGKYTHREIELAKSHLYDVRKMLIKISKENNLSIIESINLFYNNLLKNIKEFSRTDQTDFYRVRILEHILKSRNYSSIVNKAIEDGVYCETSEINYNGNIENDINALFKEYYNLIYVYKLQRLKDEYKKNPNNQKIVNQYKQIKQEKEKLQNRTFTLYELKQFEDNQKEFFEKLYKKLRAIVLDDFCSSLNIKLNFMYKMGWIDKYIKQYNHMLEKVFLSSVLGINNTEECYKNIIKDFNPSKISMQEMLALNAFWTNRFTKEVERINESLYILGRSKKIEDFVNDENNIPSDENIREYIAEYRLVVPNFTKYKLKRKEDLKEIEFLDDKRFAKFSLDASQLFSKNDINIYGIDKLNDLIFEILKLNNYTQLLYDQKDMIIENMLTYISNTNAYINAGYVIQDEEISANNKALICIDLKGYNAPIMLHYHKDKLKEIIKELTGSAEIPVYRGEKDFIEHNQNNGKDGVIATNILFPLDRNQRINIIKRAGSLKKSDTNYRYVNHISWSINPKKDMPEGINESRKTIDLDTLEVKIDEKEKKKKVK